MPPDTVTADTTFFTRETAPGVMHMDLLVPDVHCAGCIGKIEKKLAANRAVVKARVNLSTRRLAVDFKAAESTAQALIDEVEAVGFTARPLAGGETGADARHAAGRELVVAMAVAGFAAGNVMLLSVSVWSGAQDATRDLFHWLSALIALPAIGFAGRPFFRSALRALAAGTLNMDVPVSLAVILAGAMSLYETARGGGTAYFDAAVMLLFFLLAGRVLDHMMRARAHSAVTRLLSLNATSAMIEDDTGARRMVAVKDLVPGMRAVVAAGERVPADARVISGQSDVDVSIVNGEAMPEVAGPGSVVRAGTMNLTGPLVIEVTAAGPDTFLAEVVGLMETAGQAKARYVRIADRAAGLYAPLVHSAALATFAGWLWWTGGDWQIALMTAIAVLIITCPCALGLAVPAVQVVASGMAFGRGIMIKDGAALERLAEVDTVVFDKTGTLTMGTPVLLAPEKFDRDVLAMAAGLARSSRHPLARALCRAADAAGVPDVAFSDVAEHPGLGLSGVTGGRAVRLGRAGWCTKGRADAVAGAPGSVLCVDGEPLARFEFEDDIRDGAAELVAGLQRAGLKVALLSGDSLAGVMQIARQTGISQVQARCLPGDKVRAIEELQAAGHKVLMVGDGINDAPALAAAHASMAPADASDIGRTAADLVFLGRGLGAVGIALAIARRATALVHQNFALAAGYNLIAVPVAVAGLASPLVAAIAMSASSLVVTANALRLRLARLNDFDSARVVPDDRTAGTGTGALTGLKSAPKISSGTAP